MQLSVIIVNYNVKYFLEQALLSVRKAAKGLSVEVFVVDNNSVDESVMMVQEKFPEVHLIANKHNPGFSIANNQAIRQSKGKYVLLLNPDTVVEEDTFLKCINFMDTHSEAGALGVKMIDGSGNFLPESKRGFPTPAVAFYKTSGLSRLFPKSKTFNQYHLGYLDQNETHEIDILAGAFMFMRRSVLDKVGLLDETFFMYGEDIDLSYRIQKGGYKNYYFPESTIIHYKGESTKKGSLNYVKAFYNAMIIFAKKHFTGEQARLFVWMLQLAVYLQAAITIAKNTARKLFLPVLDATLIFGGMYFLKDFWATNYFNDPNYYDTSFMYFNVPLYILIWLGSVFFSGGYDQPTRVSKLVRGILMGTLVLAAVYGLLDLEYRSSRVLLILGAVWALIATVGIRVIRHFIRFGNMDLGNEQVQKLVIVGTKLESERVMQLLNQAQVQKNYIGVVAAADHYDSKQYLSDIHQLDEVVQIYQVNEIIFCAKDIPAQQIMKWMSRLGDQVSYKIVPEKSLSIIGSSSKNNPGELYTIEIQFQIATAANRRNKRLLDILVSICFIICAPILIFFTKNKSSFFTKIFQVLISKKSWVGYAKTANQAVTLPSLKSGYLSPASLHPQKQFDEATKERLNFLYAKDYSWVNDVQIIWKGYSI